MAYINPPTVAIFTAKDRSCFSFFFLLKRLKTLLMLLHHRENYYKSSQEHEQHISWKQWRPHREDVNDISPTHYPRHGLVRNPSIEKFFL